LIKKIIERVNNNNKSNINIGLFTHKKPDYDAVASTITLGNILSNFFSKKVNIIPVLEKYNFNLELYSNNECYKKDKCIDKIFDYGIVLDVNEQDYVYGYEIFNKIPFENRFLFDHHIRNRNELDIPYNQKLIQNNASSTCEILLNHIIHEYIPQDDIRLIEHYLNSDIIETNNDYLLTEVLELVNHYLSEKELYNLYIGIAADTCNFTRDCKEFTPITSKLLTYILGKKITTELLTILDTLNPEEQKLYDEITLETNNIPGLVI